MGLTKHIEHTVNSGQSGIRIDTDEIHDAITTIKTVCKKQHWEMLVWDPANGLAILNGDKFVPASLTEDTAAKKASVLPDKPLDAGIITNLRSIVAMAEAKNREVQEREENPVKFVFVVKNFNLIFERIQFRDIVTAAVQDFVVRGKVAGAHLVGLTVAEAKLPPEIDPLMSRITHELPDEAELQFILDGVFEAPEGFDSTPIVKAALGLTRLQAENCFAMSLTMHGDVRAEVIWTQKAEILNKEGLVEIKEHRLGFADVGGLQGLKDFLLRILEPNPIDEVDPDARAKGVMIVGAPGVGKSLIAECLGKEKNLPTLSFNPGNLMGEFVGVTERNTRKFFQIIRRMAPDIVIGDEIGQTMGNGQNSNSAVDNRMLGSFLTAMNDIREAVFWVFTSNDVEGMHEAFSRAERIDANVYVRLPDTDQRAQVWGIYLRKFFPELVNGKPDDQYIPLDLTVLSELVHKQGATAARLVASALMAYSEADRGKFLDSLAEHKRAAIDYAAIDDRGWTPAEIRACCRLARRLRMLPAEITARIGHVCAGEKGHRMLERLDNWARDTGALDSETGLVFGYEIAAPSEKTTVRRKAKKLDEA